MIFFDSRQQQEFNTIEELPDEGVSSAMEVDSVAVTDRKLFVPSFHSTVQRELRLRSTLTGCFLSRRGLRGQALVEHERGGRRLQSVYVELVRLQANG